MKAKSVVNNYRFLIILLLAMILGAVTGAVLYCSTDGFCLDFLCHGEYQE